MKRKTNISVQDNTGVRVTSSLIVGLKASGYKSGDILDANATQERIEELVGKTPIDLDSYIDNGSTKVIKHVEVMTLAEFNALVSKDPNTEYNII